MEGRGEGQRVEGRETDGQEDWVSGGQWGGGEDIHQAVGKMGAEQQEVRFGAL